VPQPPSQRAYKNLSEAILRGCSMRRVPARSPGIGGREGRGALQAAWLAQFPEAIAPGSYITDDLSKVYTELRKDAGNSCPSGPNPSCPEWANPRKRTLEQAIIHLEDTHDFTREKVAAWLRAYGF